MNGGGSHNEGIPGLTAAESAEPNHPIAPAAAAAEQPDDEQPAEQPDDEQPAEQPADEQPVDDATTQLSLPEPVAVPNSELAVLRNELTSALHEAHYQRRKRADAVQLLAYERLVRRSRVAGSLWLVAMLALLTAGVWSYLQSTSPLDVWQVVAMACGALALLAVVMAIVSWSGPTRARQSLSLRQVRRLTPPEMLSEAWFHAGFEVGTPRQYRRAFHGLV